MISFGREKIVGTRLLEEMFPLLQLHHDEISIFNLSPNPNIELYLRLEDQGILKVFTARKESELVGYGVYYISTHPHYKTSVQARADLLFIHPDHRGDGMRFLEFMETELKKDGAQLIYQCVTNQFDYGPVLLRRGYEPMETMYVKELI